MSVALQKPITQTKISSFFNNSTESITLEPTIQQTNEVHSLPKIQERVANTFYVRKNKILFWDGVIIKCKHKRRPDRCIICEGVGVCEHKRVRQNCIECEGVGVCEHKRVRSICKECIGGSICEHKRIRSTCRECGGGSRCHHEKLRNSCKDCSPNSFCKHKRIKSTCKECEGGSVCEHKRQRSRCKDCHGGSICKHDKVRSMCKQCEGGSFCEHERIRSRCKDCEGGGICKHKILKQGCRECTPTAFCVHNRQKSNCRDCRGACICIHNLIRCLCVECGGISVCVHKKDKRRCKECGTGKDICEHKLVKRDCSSCGPEFCPERWCKHCKYIITSNKKTRCYPYCASCYYALNPDAECSKQYQTKEREVYQLLKKTFPDFTIIHNKTVTDGCSLKRPDFLIDFGSYVIIIEVDENQHVSYKCENKRTMTLFKDLGNRNLVLIRFNPDTFKDNEGKRYSSCFEWDEKNILILNENEWNRRTKELINAITYHSTNEPEKELTQHLLFFDALRNKRTNKRKSEDIETDDFDEEEYDKEEYDKEEYDDELEEQNNSNTNEMNIETCNVQN